MQRRRYHGDPRLPYPQVLSSTPTISVTVPTYRFSSLSAVSVFFDNRLKQNALAQLCLPRGSRAALAASIKLES